MLPYEIVDNDEEPRKRRKPREEEERRPPRRRTKHTSPWLSFAIIGGVTAFFVALAIFVALVNKVAIHDHAESETSPPSDTWESDGVRLSSWSAINEDLLMIGIKVSSTQTDKRINFQTWANDLAWVDGGSSAKDSKGNQLASQDHRFLTQQIRRGWEERNPNMNMGSGSVDPGSRTSRHAFL